MSCNTEDILFHWDREVNGRSQEEVMKVTGCQRRNLNAIIINDCNITKLSFFPSFSTPPPSKQSYCIFSLRLDVIYCLLKCLCCYFTQVRLHKHVFLERPVHLLDPSCYCGASLWSEGITLTVVGVGTSLQTLNLDHMFQHSNPLMITQPND